MQRLRFRESTTASRGRLTPAIMHGAPMGIEFVDGATSTPSPLRRRRARTFDLGENDPGFAGRASAGLLGLRHVGDGPKHVHCDRLRPRPLRNIRV
jgi:hypothetical protein